MRNFAAIWLVPLLGAGCGGVVAGGPGEAQQALVTSNGIKQNGIKQNGIKQNGSGLQIAGVDLSTAAHLKVIPPTGGNGDLSTSYAVAASLYQSMIVVPTTTVPLSTNGLIMNATFTDGGTTVSGQAWIEGEAWADGSDSSIKYYTVRNHFFAPDGTENWGYICGTTQQPIFNVLTGQVSYVTVPVPATAVAGQWDYREGVEGGGSKTIEQSNPLAATNITFACIDGAIGKCVRMGYKPWEQAPVECTGSQLLGTYRCLHTTKEMMHEACVRMVRADYCGDGMPHTIDGMSLDVYDADNINTETAYAAADSSTTVPWGHEAEWTPNGARCLSQLLMTRIAGGKFSGTVADYLAQPWCAHKWTYDYDNKTPFSWGDHDCFGGDNTITSADSTYYFANVPWSKLANGNNIVTMDLHTRAWIRNKSVCVDDSYNRTAHSYTWPATGTYSAWPYNYNQDRYQAWCTKCLEDPKLPYAGACVGVTESAY